MSFDIARLLESHRRHMLAVAEEHVDAEEFDQVKDTLSIDHDRATARTLLDMYRTGQADANGQSPVGNARGEAAGAKGNQIKPGSKRARDRAKKAQVTRAANLAAKQAAGGANAGAGDEASREEGGAQ